MAQALPQVRTPSRRETKAEIRRKCRLPSMCVGSSILIPTLLRLLFCGIPLLCLLYFRISRRVSDSTRTHISSIRISSILLHHMETKPLLLSEASPSFLLKEGNISPILSLPPAACGPWATTVQAKASHSGLTARPFSNPEAARGAAFILTEARHIAYILLMIIRILAWWKKAFTGTLAPVSVPGCLMQGSWRGNYGFWNRRKTPG